MNKAEVVFRKLASKGTKEKVILGTAGLGSAATFKALKGVSKAKRLVGAGIVGSTVVGAGMLASALK